MSEWLVRGDEGQEREVSSRSEAEEVKSDMESLGVECEIVNKATDGGTETSVVEADTNTTETTQPTQTAAEKLPDEPPGIDTDPLEWIPKKFVDKIDGQVAINRMGFEVMAEHFGISCNPELVEATEDRVIHKATAEKPDGTTVTAYGEAHCDEVDREVMVRMSDTRSYKRAISRATGCGMLAVSELQSDL
jgi:hypothetical protein